MTSRFDLQQEFIATRDEGAHLRHQLEQQVAELAAGDVLEVSFGRVRAITGSATDEFLGKLLTARRAGDVPAVAIVLTGLNEETAFEVDLCLARRETPVVAIVDSGARLLGADEYLQVTFERAVALGEFNASKLAEELRVTPQNINNRLKRLVLGGALLRVRSDPESGGKQFIYRVPAPV